MNLNLKLSNFNKNIESVCSAVENKMTNQIILERAEKIIKELKTLKNFEKNGTKNTKVAWSFFLERKHFQYVLDDFDLSKSKMKIEDKINHIKDSCTRLHQNNNHNNPNNRNNNLTLNRAIQ